MQIRIITVGKIKERYLQEGDCRCARSTCVVTRRFRLSNYQRRNVPCLLHQRLSRQKVKEGERILAAIPEGSFVIALEVKGQNWSSVEMAASFRGWELPGQNHLTFVIGGDIGLSPSDVLPGATFASHSLK
ncbi:MAG: 23S rRNA (pseudouridine(1915)-N(3))-methyltransferase RlmH [Desulfobacterales bacterium]|nr:23S rRNA (pseudouridine(1915)-N(3))-methyltransferase RlmH [Desulfobacterales bacterium]